MPKKDDPSNKNPRKSTFYKKFNIVLAILVVILLIILAMRYNILDIIFTKDNKIEDLPPHGQKIIKTHDHIDHMGMLNKWLASERQCNVSTTIMVGSPNSTFWSKPKGPFIKYLENNGWRFLCKSTNFSIKNLFKASFRL